MAGITEAGLVIKTRAEIFNDIQEKIRTRISSEWDSVSNNVINIYSEILSESISTAYSSLQGVYDSHYPKAAYGVGLDNCGELVGVERIGQSRSSAPIQFTGSVGTVIPEGAAIAVSGTNEYFLTSEVLTLVSSSFSEIVLSVSTISDSTIYSVTIDGDTYSYNSGVGATATSILTGLASEINTTSPNSSASLPTSTTLNINVIEINSVLPIIVGTGLTINLISNIVNTEARSSGEIKAPLGTLNTLPVPIAGVTSVTNLADAVVGRGRETDDEFRIRRFSSVAIVGATTFEALTARMRGIEGVTSAFIIENDSPSVDADGLPSKSFEVVISGGDLDEIARAIWQYKPVGIQTFGSIARTITDQDGVPRTVRFSRPSVAYIHAVVEYKRYTEELFSSSASTGIKDAILAYGNTINVGTDIIPDRFLGAIYQNVTGLGKVTVRVAKSLDGITPVTAYTDDILVINKREAPIFNLDIISVIEV